MNETQKAYCFLVNDYAREVGRSIVAAVIMIVIVDYMMRLVPDVPFREAAILLVVIPVIWWGGTRSSTEARDIAFNWGIVKDHFKRKLKRKRCLFE